MTKEEIRAKYARIPTDFSQIEMLKNQLLDAGLLEVAQINPENAGKAIIFDENGALTIGEGGGTVSLDGNSLVIPEQEGPEPVITIDGVNYYHKQEFDLTILVGDESDYSQKYFDLLNGEELEPSQPSLSPVPCLARIFTGFARIRFDLSNGIAGLDTDIYPSNLVTYTSSAFTVVDTQEEVTDDTKICLPTCSAYYGFLSEDGKTFISYYNLKAEVPEYIDSVKQGNAVIPLKDTRVPDAVVADAGKVVKVADDGSYELGEVGSGGSDVKIVGSSVVLLNQPEPESWEIDGVTYKHRIATSELYEPDEINRNSYFYSDLTALVGPTRDSTGLILPHLTNSYTGMSARGWVVCSSDSNTGNRCEVWISSSRGLQGESHVIEVSSTIKNGTLYADYFINGYLDVNDGQHGIFYFNLVGE